MALYLGPNGYILRGRNPDGYLAVSEDCCCGYPGTCCDTLPATLTDTLTSATDYFNGTVWTLDFDPIYYWWYGEKTIDGRSYQIKVWEITAKTLPTWDPLGDPLFNNSWTQHLDGCYLLKMYEGGTAINSYVFASLPNDGCLPLAATHAYADSQGLSSDPGNGDITHSLVEG
jgi:hypothetical protein